MACADRRQLMVALGPQAFAALAVRRMHVIEVRAKPAILILVSRTTRASPAFALPGVGDLRQGLQVRLTGRSLLRLN